MKELTCAFCKRPGVMTREHLWPAALHKRLQLVNGQSASAFWLKRLERELPTEPQIRDVCAHCNNVVLSELDAYICELFDKNFARAPKRYEKIIFEYDYHPLKRWILKICYNSARIHNSVDREALETLLPYVLGREVNLGRSTQLFAQLSYPDLVSEYDVDPNSKNDEAVVFEPSGNRVGYMFFRAHGIGKKLLRAVHLRSYSFYLAYWPPGRGRAEQNDFEATFTTSNEHAKLLRPSLSSVRLQCDGMGAWSSFRDSRSTDFVFDVDV